VRRDLHVLSLASAFVFAAVVACTFNDPLADDFGACEDEAPLLLAGLTYYADIQPIIAERCGSCHREGGIAPFAFDTYQAIYPLRDLIATESRDRTMPPWPPGRCCAEYSHERLLHDAELSAILGWVADGAPEGDIADAQDTPPATDGLSRIDLELSMPTPYTPSESDGDEVRCFVIDWPENTRRYITGLDIHPGEPNIVHHAIVYAVPATKGATYQALEDADEAPGWACPGGLAEGGDTVVGGWVPGSRGLDFPRQIGRAVDPGSSLILSVHYRFAPASAPADTTQIALRLDDSVAREINGLAVYNPAWLLGETMRIPAGEADVTFAYGYDPTAFTGGAALIQNVSLHMHEHGASGSLAIERADGSVECLLNIDRWDYDWQGDYYLAEPVRIDSGDKLKVECHFDNSAANQPLGAEPVDLAWGDDQEMCIATLLVTAP